LPPPDIAVETRSLRMRLKLVASSNLLDYTARSIYLAAKDRLRLTVLPVKELAWRRAVSVVYREGSYLSPAARQLIASIKTAVAIRHNG
jgi:DNA-binding transcriptional LysR family regulator